MKIKEVQNSTIADIGKEILSDTQKLKEAIDKSKGSRIGIDFSKVERVSLEFLEFIKKNIKKGELSFYNVNVDLYVLFFIMKMDKYINFYMSESDFVKDKQCIVNRQLKLCS